MLKIEAIKTTYSTLTKNEQKDLLKQLECETYGFCSKTIDHFPPYGKHILKIFGNLTWKEFQNAEKIYLDIISSITSGIFLLEYQYVKIMVFTSKHPKNDGKFVMMKTNCFDWEENTIQTRGDFFNHFYNINLTYITLDDKPLTSYFNV